MYMCDDTKNRRDDTYICVLTHTYISYKYMTEMAEAAKSGAKRVRFAMCIYGVATISRFLKIVGLFCRISSLLWGSFAKETYDFKEPTNRRDPICVYG